PDSISKDLAFVDKVSLEATKQAKAEGAQDIGKRATEIFNDAILIEPKTDLGAEIRSKGIEYAHETTFTDNSNVAQAALNIREALNKISGDLRLGDNLMPFVKTPANIVSLGAQYSAGLAYTIAKIPQIISEAKAGSLSKSSITAIRAGIRNGLGLIIAAMLAFAFDPDDYTPDYNALGVSEQEIYKQKGAVFNSIRIGDKYVSLDYFGPLGSVLTAFLNARKNTKQNTLLSYGVGSLTQFAKIPGLDVISNIFKTIKDLPVKSTENIAKGIGISAIDAVKARTIPSIVNDLSKAFDEYERNAYGSIENRIKSGIPILREELPKKYSNITGKAIKTEPAIQTLLFGGRVGTVEDNRISKEVETLKAEGESVPISDITRYGKLRKLDENTKMKIQEEFAREFAKKANEVISSSSYQRASDDKKADKLQRVRRKISDKIKRKYKNEIKKVE
ncbi:MAG: hypothetical protein GX638_16940, partial [Crenarchaeota archaeon]|nr:hypothetical protein [Thermoproteota archaeon]